MGLRERLQAGELLVGCFLGTGSAVNAEICGQAGFDWLLIDLEHGAGTEADLVHQLQALAHTSATPLVRVEANERPRIGRALDLGAEGIMVPRIAGVEDARRAVSHLRYGQGGVRGVARGTRAAHYGARARENVEGFDERVVGVVQIESPGAVTEAEQIAAVDGVDCLFVGPADLSYSLGVFLRWDEPAFAEAIDAVAAAAARAGKATGVHVGSKKEADWYVERGFRLVAIGSDAAYVAAGARATIEAARAR